MQGFSYHNEPITIVTRTLLTRPLPTAPPTLFGGHAHLLFSKTFSNGDRADVYLGEYPSMPKYDAELRKQLYPATQVVPRPATPTTTG
jgi:hypothetical protein